MCQIHKPQGWVYWTSIKIEGKVHYLVIIFEQKLVVCLFICDKWDISLIKTLSNTTDKIRLPLSHMNWPYVRVVCPSETCAILKHFSNWHMVYHSEMCISETCFRLALCKLCHIEGRQQYVFLTHCIWSSPTFITEKQTNKQKQNGLTLGLFSPIFML